jgi:hypothetical protein
MNSVVFATLIEDRKMAAGVCGAAMLHLGCTAIGLSGWPCPLLSVSGVPCPGCGLSRATLALLRGEVGHALTLHAFAPVLLGAVTVLFAAAVLAPDARQRLGKTIREIEIRTRITAWILLGLLAYWTLRLALDGKRFIALIT